VAHEIVGVDLPGLLGIIPKTVMNDVPSAPIGDFENTLSFPSKETPLGSGLPSHLPSGDALCPSSPSHGFLHHTIGTLNNALWIHAITVLVMLGRWLVMIF